MQTRHEINLAINDYFSKVENPIIFELGCHLGEDSYTLFNLSRGYARYFAFEPVPDNVFQIKRMQIPKNIEFHLIQSAVCDFTGQTDLYLSGGTHLNGRKNTMASSIRKPKNVKTYFPFISFDNTIRVNTTTIDDFCEANNISNINFIWCDIQGCEYDMICGAKNMLKNIDMMLLEYSNVELYEGERGLQEILDCLGDDFELYVQSNEDILVINKRII